jgi:hypothetical protein
MDCDEVARNAKTRVDGHEVDRHGEAGGHREERSDVAIQGLPNFTHLIRRRLYGRG